MNAGHSGRVWAVAAAMGLAALGGCSGEAGRSGGPTLTLAGRGSRNVYLVLQRDAYYHACRKCDLCLDADNVLCDGQGRRLSVTAIPVPAEAKKVRVQPDGVVLVYCYGSWCGLGRIMLVRVPLPAGSDMPVPACLDLNDLGDLGQPGSDGFPEVRPVQWTLASRG